MYGMVDVFSPVSQASCLSWPSACGWIPWRATRFDVMRELIDPLIGSTE